MGRTQAGENGNDTKVTMHRDDEVESLEKAVRVRKRDLTFRNHEFERPGGADSEEEFSNRGKGAAAHFRCVDGRSLCLKPFRAEFIDEFLQVCIATQIWRVRSNLEDRHGRLEAAEIAPLRKLLDEQVRRLDVSKSSVGRTAHVNVANRLRGGTGRVEEAAIDAQVGDDVWHRVSQSLMSTSRLRKGPTGDKSARNHNRQQQLVKLLARF